MTSIPPHPSRPPGRRRRRLLALAGAVLVAGGLGSAGAVLTPDAPRAAGDQLLLDGAALRVLGGQELSAATHHASGRASGAGTTGADQPPPGSRRVSVEVTLAALSDEVRYAPEELRLAGDGAQPVAPLRARFSPGVLPVGHAVSGQLTYEVPVDARSFALHWRGGTLPVVLAPNGRNGRQGATEDQHGDTHEQRGATHDEYDGTPLEHEH